MAEGNFSVEPSSASFSNLQAQVSAPENFSSALGAIRQFGSAAQQPQP